MEECHSSGIKAFNIVPQNGANGPTEAEANGETSSRTSTPPKAGNGPVSTNDGDNVSLIEEKIEIYCYNQVSTLFFSPLQNGIDVDIKYCNLSCCSL